MKESVTKNEIVPYPPNSNARWDRRVYKQSFESFILFKSKFHHVGLTVDCFLRLSNVDNPGYRIREKN